mgnify:CR=1 FL=1
MEFKVKGTSYCNENDQKRQELIQKVIKTYIDNDSIEKEELYDGNTNKDIKDYDLKVSIYEGISFPAKLKKNKYKNEDCIEVYLLDYYKNQKMIGYVPKELVHIILNDIDEEKEISVEIIGGKYKEYDILEDKVVIDDIGMYGIKINYTTREEKKEIENKRKLEKQKQINAKEYNKKQQTQNLIIELIICIFLGILGGHKFYKGKVKVGFLYLFTGGMFGIGWLIDIIKLLIEFKNIKAL